MSPTLRAVELMSDGETRPAIFPFLTGILNSCGMLPVIVKKESTGFIFNRLWAAVKREVLLILAEGISSPQEIDMLWEHIAKSSPPPCRLMDYVGLDTVAFIEDTYIKERRLDGSMTVGWLREQYINQGQLGIKSSRGGFYSPMLPHHNGSSNTAPSVYFLDIGIGENLKDFRQATKNGKLLCLKPGNKTPSTLISGLNLPDGIDISVSTGRIFWTCMCRGTRTFDGSITSANLDGSDVRTILQGQLYTPKQLVVEETTEKLYFCDREGMSVHRCDLSGQSHEVLVRRGDILTTDNEDSTQWCVGVAVDVEAGKIYWTKKGPS